MSLFELLREMGDQHLNAVEKAFEDIGKIGNDALDYLSELESAFAPHKEAVFAANPGLRDMEDKIAASLETGCRLVDDAHHAMTCFFNLVDPFMPRPADTREDLG